MAMRSKLHNQVREALWLFAISGSVVLCGCGKRPESAPKPAETAQNAVTSRPKADTEATRPLARTLEPAANVPAAGNETGASSPAKDASKASGVTLPATRKPERASQQSEVPHATSPDANSLEKQLAALQVPPAWLDDVRTQYDTSHPWKDARLEIRRLLSLNTDAARKEAVKLTWLYLQKNDIGDGHEYPMYLFLGGEPLWSVRAHEEFLAKPHKVAPDHAYISLASLYTRYGEFEKAKATLAEAMARLPDPPWRIARTANLHEAFGDLFTAWAKLDLARVHYAEAVRLYPKSNQPYGQHLLKRQAARTQSKLDLLSIRSLADATLRDGRYTTTALGYAGDMDIAVTVRKGRIADIRVKHQEKIDQGACHIIPQRIIEKQSLQVDAISGATVTTSAIIDGTLQCLRKAGLQ